jgi:hypothetical protein
MSDNLKARLTEEQATQAQYEAQGRPEHLYDPGRRSRIDFLKQRVREEAETEAIGAKEDSTAPTRHQTRVFYGVVVGGDRHGEGGDAFDMPTRRSAIAAAREQRRLGQSGISVWRHGADDKKTRVPWLAKAVRHKRRAKGYQR